MVMKISTKEIKPKYVHLNEFTSQMPLMWLHSHHLHLDGGWWHANPNRAFEKRISKISFLGFSKHVFKVF